MAVKFTLEDYKQQGANHASYGWKKQPQDHWSDAEKVAYDEGYEEYCFEHFSNKLKEVKGYLYE